MQLRTAFLDMLVTFLAGHDALIDVDAVLAGAPVPDREEPQRLSLARRSTSRNSRRRRRPPPRARRMKAGRDVVRYRIRAGRSSIGAICRRGWSSTS